MIKPVRWNTFIRDFLVIQIGFALFGLSIALTIRANLGTGTWSVFEVALSQITGLTVGTITVIVGFTVLIGALALREKVGWGTLGNILSIGPWLDLALWLIPSVEKNLILQSAMLLGGVLAQGIASAVYIGVDAGAGPRDSLMLALHRTTKLSLRVARGSVEITVFILGWFLGGPAGIGTAVFALLIGPSVQWAFKIFNVHPHREEAEPQTSIDAVKQGDTQ
ncbi:MAG: membrane protein [Anaerolineaceae bacterium]|nr:MAG: membrane protein [Anaerolineaceae bacterium]